MYTKGADEAKQWILKTQKFLTEAQDLESEIDNIEDDEEMEEEDERSPFDILEKVREIVNADLKDPEDDEEIEAMLKEIAAEVKSYVSDEDEEEKELSPEDEEQGMAPDMSLGTNPDDEDSGANSPGDMQAALGGQLGGNFPASGGQM